MSLNAKQQLFVKEYLIDKNATRAAKAAGYSAKTAQEQGSRLLSNVMVKTEIEKGLEAQKANAEKRAASAGLTKERWLAELRLIALANMDDYAQIEEFERYQGTDGEPIMGVQVTAVPTKKRHRRLGAAIKKISETKNGIGIELHSKQAALETLGKHYGWVKEHVDLNTPGGVQVHLVMPSNGREAEKPETTDTTPESTPEVNTPSKDEGGDVGGT